MLLMTKVLSKPHHPDSKDHSQTACAPPTPFPSPHVSACLELLLVFSEEDVEGAGKAPHGEHQEQQEPLHISHHRAQSVDKGILGRLEHPAPAYTVKHMPDAKVATECKSMMKSTVGWLKSPISRM